MGSHSIPHCSLFFKKVIIPPCTVPSVWTWGKDSALGGKRSKADTFQSCIISSAALTFPRIEWYAADRIEQEHLRVSTTRTRRVRKCQPAQGWLLSWRANRARVLPTFGAVFRSSRAEARWAKGAHKTEPSSPSTLQQNSCGGLQRFSRVNRIYLQTSESPPVPLITARVSTGCLAWYQKTVCTHKSKLVQKLSKENDGVTFDLRGETRNRH